MATFAGRRVISLDLLAWSHSCAVSALIIVTRRRVKIQDVSRDPGGGHSLIWPIRGRAAGQGMVFGLLCPEQGTQFYANLS